MQLKYLISEIIPYYNKYRKNKLIISGIEVLEISWEIGDLLDKFIKKNNVAPHALYREIYGKSEGEKNIEQKSYVTREFLGRCYRIRKMFNQKSGIRFLFPDLKNFNNFREAMPFFDNQKYLLKGENREELIKILNSNLENRKIKEYIKKLQKEKIGIKNPRDQKLKKMSGDKEVFIKFYNYIYEMFKWSDYERVYNEIKDIDTGFIKVLSKNTGAISIDGLLFTDFEVPNSLNEKWFEFASLIKRLIEKKDPLERRRFRRLIPPHRMTQLGEMLYQLTSESLYKTFRP